MKKLIVILTLLAFMLSACGDGTLLSPTDAPVIPADTQPPQSMSANTTPETPPALVVETEPTEPTETESPFVEVSHGPDEEKMPRGDDGKYYCTYSGDEVCIPYTITTNHLSRRGIGFFVFVDGQPQPYKTSEFDTYSYMHTFYPKDNETVATQIMFTPVAGEKGETVEVWIGDLSAPNCYEEGDMIAFGHTSGMQPRLVLLHMDAEPETAELPQIPDQMLSVEIEYQDLPESATKGWTKEDLATRCDWEFGYRRRGAFTISREKPVELKFELWGSTVNHFGFVLFVDNQPVSVSAEDIVLIDVQEGKKTVVYLTLDASLYDGLWTVYGILVPRDAVLDEIDTFAYHPKCTRVMTFRETQS